MARLIWTEPALLDLDEIAEYIALDDPAAASRYVQNVFDGVARLEAHPKSGKRPPEPQGTPYRAVPVPPSRTSSRIERDTVYILYIMRSERLLRPYLLGLRDSEK